MSSKIVAVGFEIEGGWDGKPGVSPFPDGTLIPDHSINGQTLGGARAILATHVGEAVSPPLPYTSPWEDWLLTHWPDAEPRNRTNRTCGYHIHISLSDFKSYSLLSTKSFMLDLQKEFVELGKKVKLPEKHVFWERILGYNTFCTLEYNSGAQMKIRQKGGKVRYGWLNCSYAMHKTLELRALPTFRDIQVALRFTAAYFDFVDKWLELNADAELRFETTLKG